MTHTAEGVIARQGHETADGRLFERFEFRKTIRIRAQFIDGQGGHDNAEALGILVKHEVRENGDIYGWIEFADTPEAIKAARLVDQGALSGISIDGSNVWSYEMSQRVMDQNGAVVTEEQQEKAAAAWLVEKRAERRQAVLDAGGDEDDADAAENSVWTDWSAIMRDQRWRMQLVYERAVIAGATLVAIPAFPEAELVYTGPGFTDEEIAASAIPLYPAEAFAKRDFLRATALQWSTWTDEQGVEWGVVCGHVAPWDVPHEATGQVLSRDDFSASKFLSGVLPTTDGGSVKVGQLTVADFHARPGATGRRLTNRELFEHYERSDKGAAHLTVHADEHGVQVAGLVAAAATPAMVEQAMACAPSLHTRRTGGVMTLYGLLAVNQQGYVIERYDDDGDTHEIAASWAGLAAPDQPTPAGRIDRVVATAAADRQVLGG